MIALRLLSAVAVMAFAAPAMAQDPVPVAGPYYIVSADTGTAMLVAGGTRARRGDVATISVAVLLSPETQAGLSGVTRMYMGYEFQCRANQLRSRVTSFISADGSVFQTLTDEDDWETVGVNAPSEQVRDMACENRAPANEAGPQDDLRAVEAIYYQWVAEQ